MKPFLFVPVVTILLIGLQGCSTARQPSQEQSSAQPATQQQPPSPPAYFHPDPATVGTVTGKVAFTGKLPARKKIDMDDEPQCQQLHKTPMFDQSEVVNRNRTLANVFVYVKSGLEGKPFEPPTTPVTIDQRGCWFIPRVLGLQTGQTLRVTNSDPVTHNIHPRPHENREWNHSQAPETPPFERKFTRPEVMVRVKCNVHGWMHAWIGVVDHPYFAVTGEDGSFEFKNLPPGTYTVGAWQEELGTQEKTVVVPPSGKSPVQFSYKGES